MTNSPSIPGTAKGVVLVAEVGGVVSGLLRISGEPPIGVLHDLSVRAAHLGQGLGEELMTHAKQNTTDRPMMALAIHSDPNAHGYYERVAATDIRTVGSGSIRGRLLPGLIVRLDE